MDMPITDAGFDFLNEECDTIFFNDFDSKGNEIQLLRVKNENDIIKFRIRENLFREGDEGKDKDVLMDFISIKFGDIELLGEFLNLNGFLFKIGKEEYSLFKCKDIFFIIHRMSILTKLIYELGRNIPDYLVILKSTFYLLLTPPISFRMNDKVVFSTPNMSNPDFDIYGLTSDVPFYEFNSEDEFREDTIYWDSYYARKQLDNHFAYTNYYENPNYQVDFLASVCDYLEYINLKETAVLNIEAVPFKYESIILDTARNVIKKEMDSHLSKITPTYNPYELETSWDIPDLITVLYFSILFQNPKFRLIKKCKKPDCPNFFTVTKSNDRKIYCTRDCANTMSQRNYRKNH